MQSKTKITSRIVNHIADLSHIPVTQEESEELARGFTDVLKVVDTLTTIDTKTVPPVGQVTGLENVTQEDVVDTTKMFPQEDAIRNAHRSHKGYFVVDRILNK